MIIQVQVKPQAKKDHIEHVGQVFKVSLTAPAHEGRANKRLLELVAEYFSVKKYQVRIVRGRTSRNKFLEIDQNL